jgi:hypothetical protein
LVLVGLADRRELILRIHRRLNLPEQGIKLPAFVLAPRGTAIPILFELVVP